jgi:hypothetical protein
MQCREFVNMHEDMPAIGCAADGATITAIDARQGCWRKVVVRLLDDFVAHFGKFRNIKSFYL